MAHYYIVQKLLRRRAHSLSDACRRFLPSKEDFISW